MGGPLMGGLLVAREIGQIQCQGIHLMTLSQQHVIDIVHEIARAGIEIGLRFRAVNFAEVAVGVKNEHARHETEGTQGKHDA